MNNELRIMKKKKSHLPFFIRNSSFLIHNSSKGFTLLESLVAISVFTVGISAAVFVITASISVGSRTKHKIIAANLAQEGLEVVRNIRDRNWLAGRPWTQGIDSLTNGCVQYNSEYNTVDASCSAGSNLIFTAGRYAHSTGASDFSRTITTQYFPPDTPAAGDPEKLKVVSSVVCGINCSISLEEYLYNWK